MKQSGYSLNQDNWFFINSLKIGELNLSKDESHHCIKSLRKQAGNIINITDGKGQFAEAKIIDPNQKDCRIKVNKILFSKKGIAQNIHIAISPTKNIKRYEWFIEKATEIGIGSITPIICQNSERKNININRSRQKTITALKQSLQKWLVKINPLVTFEEFLSKNYIGGKFICEYNSIINSELKENIQKHNNFTILIGPEGGFTKEEIQLAEANQFDTISLGKNRYRTETAGILACHTISLFHNA